MYASLGISAEQVYGDMYTAWLRDTHEKNTNDVKRLYTTMIENGFGEQQIFMRRQRLGANFISSLAPLLHQCSFLKLDLHGNMLRDVGCELLVHVLRDLPQLTYLDLGANAIGCSSVVASGIIGGGGGAVAGGGGSAASGKSRGAGGAASSRGGGAAAAAANAPAAGAAGGGGSGARSAASSNYLNAMQGLGAAIAQHKRLSILILGSDREEAYTNQIEVTGAMLVLEGCLLSRTLKRLDLSGNPLAVNDGASAAGSGGGAGAPGADARRAQDGANGMTSANSSSGVAVSGRLGSPSPPEGDRSAAGTPAAGNGGTAGIMGGGGGGGYAVKSAPRTPVQVLAQLLRTSMTLTHLTLRAIGLSDAGAAQLFDAAGTSRTLQQLDISANGLSSRVADVAGALMLQRTAAVRGGALGCTLQSLLLSHNDLWDNNNNAALVRRDSFGMGGGMTSSKFAGRTRALRSTAGDVGDGENPLQQHHHNPSPGLTLLSALSHDQFVTALYLDDCAMDDSALLTLCRALMTNAMLKVLSMRRNSLSPDGVVQLGRALCRHPCLERLLISGNPIEDEGVCALATALGQPDASLVEVDVAKTWLGDRGLIALGVALQMNTSLRALHISDNHFTHHGGAAFAALLENNTCVVRCELGATSVPHHIVLRLERTTARNRARAENASADALKAEVVRLHYQKYKLLEAHIELEALRESNAEVKRTTENFDLQTKQDHGDFVKRIRELEELIENAQQQDVRYTEQKAKLEADLAKAERAHEEDMTYVAERLAVEVGLREKAEAEMQKLQTELVDWQENGAAREQQKRERLTGLKTDQEAWATQRRAYRERATELQQQVAAQEAAVASMGAGTSKTRRKSGKK